MVRARLLQPMQNGFIVDDVQSALRYWTEVVGAGPFFVMEAHEWTELTYNSQPTNVHIRIFLGQWGRTQIEFIEQLNDAPSPYIDFRASGRRGLHHFGVYVEDLDAEIAEFAARGKPAIYRGATQHGFRFAYLVDDEHNGSMIELIEEGPASNALRSMIADAARGWDGSDPIRPIA